MKPWKILTAVGIAIIAIALLTTTAYGYMGGSVNTPYGGMMGSGGMMGGYGNGYPNNNPSAKSHQSVCPFQFGGGCLGRMGWTGNSYTTTSYTYTGAPLNITTATTIAKNYITSLNNPDLTVKQVEEYSANYYAQVNEKSTGNGAFELLINKYTGSVYPEMGPNMMWNTKYGMMRGGILGGIFGTPTATMTVTATQAKTNAQQYLNSYLPGNTTGDITTFYGYYTIEVLNGSSTYGMLSVNGYTGQVWYHTWHGNFIQELQVS